MMREKSRFESKTTPAASRRIRPQVKARHEIPVYPYPLFSTVKERCRQLRRQRSLLIGVTCPVACLGYRSVYSTDGRRALWTRVGRYLFAASGQFEFQRRRRGPGLRLYVLGSRYGFVDLTARKCGLRARPPVSRVGHAGLSGGKIYALRRPFCLG